MAFPGFCAFIVDGETCPDPGSYTIRVDKCPLICCVELLYCLGHPACPKHAAELRAGLYMTAESPAITRQQDVDVWEIVGAAR